MGLEDLKADALTVVTVHGTASSSGDGHTVGPRPQPPAAVLLHADDTNDRFAWIANSSWPNALEPSWTLCRVARLLLWLVGVGVSAAQVAGSVVLISCQCCVQSRTCRAAS